MRLQFPNKLTQFEQDGEWFRAADYLYALWLQDPDNRNLGLCAGLEQWYYMTILGGPLLPTMNMEDFNLCMQRLSVITERLEALYPNHPDYLALFGYCMRVQPFWFYPNSRGEEIHEIEARGKAMITAAHGLSPEDEVISAIATGQCADLPAYRSKVSEWGDCAITVYFRELYNTETQRPNQEIFF